MRIQDIIIKESAPIVPVIKWKTNGDGSYTVRIEYTPDKVYVHTNKNFEVLKKIVDSRYGPKTFV